MPNIKDVAKKAGYSISTVSYALNNDKRIPDVTARRIKKIANEIGYLPSAAARSLKKKTTNTILVAISDFGGPVYHELLDGIHHGLSKHGYTMIVSTGVSTERLLHEKSADGAIISDINISDEMLKQIANKFRPIIVLDRDLMDTNIYNMTINNRRAMYLLVSDILKKGYKKLTFVHGVKNTYDNDTRFEGFKEALQDNNLEVFSEYEGNFTKPSGIKIVKKLLQEKDLPDMIVCSNDEMALGAIETLQANGKLVPGDIGVSGFDDIELSSYVSPKLSSVKINHTSWGKKIAKVLIDLLKKRQIHIQKEEGEIKIRGSY